MPTLGYMKIILCAFFLTALTAQLSYAIPVVSIDQSGIISGSGMDGVAGLDLTVVYDASILSAPNVTKGALVSKALLTSHTPQPGIIRIAIISYTPFSGSGQIAIINFASSSGANGIRPFKEVSAIDINGTKLAVQYSGGAASSQTALADAATQTQPPSSDGGTSTSSDGNAPGTVSPTTTNTTTQITTQTTNTSTTYGTSTGTSSGSSTTSTARTYVPGYITDSVPAEADSRKSTPPPQHSAETTPLNREEPPQQPEADRSEPVASPAPSARETAESKSYESGQNIIFKGILERFKNYRGEKSLPVMTALFRKEVSSFISQKPPIVLSDGKSKVAITVEIPASNTTSPNFAMDNAAILSVRKDGQRRWIIEALPESNSFKAALNVIVGENSYEYPLTVAPALPNSIKTDQAGWEAFRKQSASQKKGMSDLNGDGLSDYIDEFIFIANHLADTMNQK